MKNCAFPAVAVNIFLFAAVIFTFQTAVAQRSDIANSRSDLTHTELADELEILVEDSRSSKHYGKAARQISLEDLAARELPIDLAERKELARAWKSAARLVLETEGHTPFLAEALRLASELDPDDINVARTAAFEAVRQEKVNARIDEAQRLADLKGGQK